jgi:uncharacterized surface protein with fasciclin (FAS1) repeats
LELIALAGFVNFFSLPGPFTMFAPSDEVFQGYWQEFIEALL